MDNFDTIQRKLEQFIKKYYTNELIKGAILFFAIGLLYFLFTLFVEYVLWLNPTARTVLFWLFIAVEVALFLKFIALPITKLFKLRKGMDYEAASRIIGNHFPEVDDKLLNVLQLKDNAVQSELLLASIDQKSDELKPVPFKLAINFKENLRYVKYAAIPLLIIAASYISGKIEWFSDSYERVVNYSTAYEPPAPFQFFVVNEDMKAIEDKDFTLKISTVGKVIPDNAQIHFNGQSYFLQQLEAGQFQFTIPQPKDNIIFNLSANDVRSKDYSIEVIKVPSLLSFDMLLDYPAYTKKKDETLKNLGSATIPEGTRIKWTAKTKATDKVTLYAKDTLQFTKNEDDVFEAFKRVFSNLEYSISTSNENLQDYENLAFSLNVVKDAYPELNLKAEKDSIDGRSLYFYGQVSDDYGLSKLQMVYYPVGQEDKKVSEPITINKSNFDEFVGAFPNQLNLEEGVDYELYFQVFDNDVLHNYKSVKSSVFSYRKLTKDEEEQRQLDEQNETIKDINDTFDKLQDQDKKLEEFSKTQKEKEELNFNDQKKFEDFLKRQKEQEQLMQNFNKRLQENLEEFQNENEEQDEFKEDLQERLKENEEQLQEDEKLLEELEKIRDKISKEEFTEKLEELAKQNKNKKRSMEQLLELTKRYYVSKKAEKLMKELEKLADKQEDLSKKDAKENTKEAQEELNKAFEELQKEMEELQKENKDLKKPMEIPRDKPTEESIKQDQKEASEQLEQKEQQEQKQQDSQEEQTPQEQQMQQQMQNAQKKQKQAAKKMKQMSQQLGQMMQMGGGEQMAEDAAMLRQILDNLVLFSFDQESLMDQFKSIDVGHNQYGKFIIKQSDLREHFEHIDDSLFALSLRQPKLSEQVNKQITDVYFNIDKTLDQLSENRLYQGVASQQYTITATNTLANFLSDVLDNMESQMNAGMGQGGQQDMQLPDIIMSQEQLNKQMQQGMKQQQEGEGQEGKEGEKPNEGKEGEQQGKEGEGQEGENGKEKEGDNGKQQGEGEGSSSEKINGELYEIYRKQQQLRQALQDKIGKDGSKGQVGDLIKKMEEVELDLINKGFTNQTLEKMMQLQHQLLKLENATFQQGQDNKRKSETNFRQFNNSASDQLPTARQYFNTTEILNRQALPLQQRYKKKVQEYFKTAND